MKYTTLIQFSEDERTDLLMCVCNVGSPCTHRDSCSSPAHMWKRMEAVLIDTRHERRRQAAHLMAVAWSKVPDGHDHWTVRMLAGQAVERGDVRGISPETVRHLLKKTR